MTLTPTATDVGVVAKLFGESPEAANELARIALFESFADQLEALRPQMEIQVHKNLAETTAAARRAMLRSHVGKALEGQEEPDDVAYAEALAVLDEYVEKSLSGWLLAQFNERVNRDEHGRFARKPSHMAPQGGPQFTNREHGRQQSAVDLASLTLGTTQRQGERLTRGIFTGEGGVRRGDDMAADWYAPTEGVDRQAYRRLQLTGQALAGASAQGSSTNFVGNLTALAGELGPEAEKVLGPGIRRTAYRYRGTERRPDVSVTSLVDQAAEYADGLAGDEAARARTLQAMSSQYVKDKGSNPAVVIANRWKDDRKLTDDQRTLLLRGDAAVASFLAVDGKRDESLLPDLDLVRLSLESGEMPPSQGVIIDAEGRVATQAIGYNGDHYLPFDLRNLGALQGGQYIRTRATGGLTTEDIYTGLLTGARQIQVVSNSGVFTMEFDPDFRGARRYNDKAHRMIERYGSILETIQGKQVFEPGGDLPAKEMSRLRTEAAAAARTQEEFDRNLTQLTDQARMKASFSEVDMEQLEEGAREHGKEMARQEYERDIAAGRPAPSGPENRKRAADYAGQYMRDNQPTVRRMKLDGVGYDNAMRALQQEFPYYIRSAKWQPLDDWLATYDFSNRDLGYRRHAPTDLGYTEPGQTNAPKTRRDGFRSSRTVPTKTRRTRAATAAAEAEAAAKPAGEKAAAPARVGQPTPEERVAALTPEAMVAPGSPVMRKVNVPASGLIANLAKIKLDFPAEGATDEDVIRDLGAFEYLHWKTQQFKTTAAVGQQGQAFFRWLATEATPQQVEAIREGMDTFIAERASVQGEEQYGHVVAPADSLRAQRDEIFGYYALVHPFAEVEAGQEPHMVEPAGEAPRPPKMPGVPDITAPERDFEHARAQLELGNDELKRLNANFEQLADEDQVVAISQAYDDFISGPQDAPALKKIIDFQTAWSFAQAKRLADRLRELAGTDAAPLAKSDLPRRRLIFG